MTARLRLALLIAPLLAACAVGGNERAESTARDESAECSARVIVRFAAAPDAALLADIERTSSLELEPQGAIANDLRVYVLRAAGSDGDCVAAIDRLRRDPRIRSVDLDSRRELHDR